MRSWATDAARDLALDLYYDRNTTAHPFEVGVVLGPGERVWAEMPLRFSADIPTPPSAAGGFRLPLRPWLVTNRRLVARLGDDRLHGWRWEHVVGCRVDLVPGRETAALDLDAQTPLVWTGPASRPSPSPPYIASMALEP
jgi:hypothetical protein